MSAVRNRCHITTDITAVFPPAVTLPTRLHVTDSYSALVGQLAVSGWIIRQTPLGVDHSVCHKSQTQTVMLSVCKEASICLLSRFEETTTPSLNMTSPKINLKMICESTQKGDGRFFFLFFPDKCDKLESKRRCLHGQQWSVYICSESLGRNNENTRTDNDIIHKLELQMMDYTHWHTHTHTHTSTHPHKHTHTHTHTHTHGQ